jgi:4-hydroxybenzoate polyprenyltransferase
MVAIQASIGALNDVVDAAIDAGRKVGKPIPNGHATQHEAVAIAATGLALGVALTWPSGLGATTVALAGAGCGYLYDLRLSRSAWSWLAFALGLPLVPLYAWVGATGGVPGPLLRLLPIGALAGAGLALANGLADLERDLAGGIETAAGKLGRARAWTVHAGLLVAAVGLALVSLPASVSGTGGGGRLIVPIALFGGVALIGTGLALGRGGGAGMRERAWELEALGVAAFGAGWVAAVATVG